MADTPIKELESTTIPSRFLDILKDRNPDTFTTSLPLLGFTTIRDGETEHHTIQGTVYWRYYSMVHAQELLESHQYLFDNTRLVDIHGTVVHALDVRMVKGVTLLELANLHVINIQNLPARPPHKGWTDPIPCPVLQLSLVFDSHIAFHIVG